MSSGIVSEDAHTFGHTFDLVLEVAPQLATDVFVLLLDGDRATWQAAKQKFENVVIILCLFHASENMKKRFGPICRSFRGASQSSTNDSPPNLSRWIQCQNSACCKWRKLSDSVEYPSEFYCTEVTWSANSIDCDTPQDENFNDESDDKHVILSEVLYCTLLHTALFCTAIFCTALYCTLHCTAHCNLLHCTLLHTPLFYTALFCTAFRCTLLHCTLLHNALHCTLLHTAHCILLHCTLLHTALFCTALDCTLHCTAHCNLLHCTLLHCTRLHTSLHCTLQSSALQSSALHSTAHCTPLHSSALHSTAHCTLLHCVMVQDLVPHSYPP